VPGLKLFSSSMYIDGRETGNYNGRCGRKQRRLSSGDVYPEAVASRDELS
jgi:hypothetical protein